MAFKEIAPEELMLNPFTKIGKEWMLITAGADAEHCNTMTASWGGLGVLWNANVSFAFVRPSRYTYEFMEREPYYSLSFLDPGGRRPLQYCGAHSGREVDKLAETGLVPRFDAPAPYFEQARLALICRKMYTADIDPDRFLDPAISASYKEGDYHRMYVGEIVKVLQAMND